jgi:hypothetical protein
LQGTFLELDLSQREKKVPFYRRRLSERTLGLFGALGTLLGICGIVASIWTGIFAVKDPQVIVNIVFGMAIIFGVAFLGIAGVLAQECISAEREINRVTAERLRLEAENAKLRLENAAILQQKIESDQRIGLVARPFHEISEALVRLEADVSAFRDQYREAKVISLVERPKQRADLRNQFEATLLAICDAAAHVLPIKKGVSFVATNPTCSANIKLVEIKRSGVVAVYQVLKRSSHSNLKRYEDDRVQLREVSRNMLYKELIEQRDVIVIPDIEDYVKRLESNPALRNIFDEPKIKACEFYKSCLIAPIFGVRSELLESSGEEPPTLVGIFCVDSDERDFFDKGYDRTIMSQLANHAQTCIRAYSDVIMKNTF